MPSTLFITSPYFIKIFIGTFILGFATGAIGIIPTLRKQALVGDALSHAALPGVVIAFMLFNTKTIEVLLIGAAVASIIAMVLMEVIKKHSNVKFDASMALILSSFFGFGNVLMNMLTGSGQAGISKFIFGEAATMLERDVILITIVSIVVILLALVFWRHIKLFIFNQEYYSSLGFNSVLINGLVTFLTVLVVIISIRTIGVVLMSALLIAPAVSARLWSDKFKNNFIIAGLIGAISGGLGTYFSFLIKGLPTGPAIVVILSIFLIVSLLFSPKKGLIYGAYKNKRQKKQIKKYHSLIHFYEYEEFKEDDSIYIENYLNDKMIAFVDNKYVITSKGEKAISNILGGKNIWD